MIKNVTFSNTSKSDFLAFTQCYLKHYFVSHQLMYSKASPIYCTVNAFQVNIRQGDQSKTLSLYIEPHKTRNTSVGSVLFFICLHGRWDVFYKEREWTRPFFFSSLKQTVLDIVSQSQISSLKTSPKDKKIWTIIFVQYICPRGNPLNDII